MSDDNPKSDDADISLSGRAIALAIVENDSLAMVLQESGMKLREFIVLSFVSDQGPLNIDRLARLIGIDLDTTDLGNLVAKKILSQL